MFVSYQSLRSRKPNECLITALLIAGILLVLPTWARAEIIFLSNFSEDIRTLSGACAIGQGGAVKCWGPKGRAANAVPPWLPDNLTAVSMPGLSGTRSLAAGASENGLRNFWGVNCAIIGNTGVRCWGNDNFGALGNGLEGQFINVPPVPAQGLAGVGALASSGVATCALLVTGQARCWGLNSVGQLGDGTSIDRNVPTPVTTVSNISAIGIGVSHSCAVESGGSVKCWGMNNSGQFGLGTLGDPLNPVLTAVSVPNVSGATSIAVGTDHTCVIVGGGEVRCWGDNGNCQLGALVQSPSTAVTVNGIVGAKAIVAGEDHNCALLSNGIIKCWGDNTWGSLGDGTDVLCRYEPSTVVGIAGATAIGTGPRHTCARIASGEVKCWGWNDKGELGNGRSSENNPDGIETSNVPVNVVGLQ